ncbi:MAG: hypothetical protein HKN22_02370, partial [Bacteroidia bacterium]|nr:hypothetical protein [Bacteroidia bacterium]
MQTFVAKRATKYISKELNANVEIDRIGIKLFSKVDLSGFYIEDLKGDTLLYAKHLVANINSLDLKARYVDISDITLQEPVIRFRKAEGETAMNLDFIVDYFKKDTTAGRSQDSDPFKIIFNKIDIVNAKFSLHNNNYKAKENEIDFKHINLNKVTGTFEDLAFVNDSVLFNVIALEFNETGGLQVDKLVSKTVISDRG